MPLRLLDQSSGLIHQLSGNKGKPAVVYLPGVHGDWTPHAAARPLLKRRLHLVEVAYPRTDAWTIAHFSQALEALLDTLQLDDVHLVGDSFGSLVAWQFGLSRPERVRSLVLVGGFCQPPRLRVAGSTRWALTLMPTMLLEKGIDIYSAYKSRKGEDRTTAGSLAPYPAVRTRRGRRATANRMAIIQRTDIREHLPSVRFPVRYVGGAADWVVPVRREVATLYSRLPAACGFEWRILPDAPHAIIASHPQQTADSIADWIAEIEGEQRKP